ncbi:MAG: hypothetical protein Roseis2KO_48880 [Roseivirga sp.]
MRNVIILLSAFFISTSLLAQEGKKQLVFTATGLTEQAQKFLDREEYDKAIEFCDKALEAASIYREAYIVKHKTYEAKGTSSAQKIENLKAAQKISLEDEELAYYLGKIYQKGSRFDDAIKEYSNAINYSVGDSEFRYFYFFSRGTCYTKKRKNEEAIADFTEALKIRPESTSALANRGFGYYNLKEKTKSCADWRKARDLGSNQVNTYISQYCK